MHMGDLLYEDIICSSLPKKLRAERELSRQPRKSWKMQEKKDRLQKVRSW